MRAFATDLAHVFLSLHFYAVCMLAGASVVAFRSAPKSPFRSWRYWLAGACVLFYIASAQLVSDFLYGKFESVYPVPALGRETSAGTTILVLTAGTPQSTPEGYRSRLGADAVQRVMSGVELWRRIGGRLMFSGAPTPDLSDSIAHEMARLAMGLGVPKDAILIESRSINTYENILYSQTLLREAGAQGDRVVMVVSAFQMPRAVAVARKLSLDVVPYPCGFQAGVHSRWQYWIPSNDGAQDFESVLHELIGMAMYSWRGWI